MKTLTELEQLQVSWFDVPASLELLAKAKKNKDDFFYETERRKASQPVYSASFDARFRSYYATYEELKRNKTLELKDKNSEKLGSLKTIEDEFVEIEANIRKSHTRGFSNEKRAEKANVLIKAINKLVTSLEDETIKNNLWATQVQKIKKAFFRLKVYQDIPDELPDLPYTLKGNSIEPDEELIDPDVRRKSTSQSVTLRPSSLDTSSTSAEHDTPVKSSENAPRTHTAAPTPEVSPESTPEPTPNNSEDEDEDDEMTTNEFMKMAETILPRDFSGQPDKLQQALDALSLLSLHTTAQLQSTAIAVIKTRLSGAARDCITDQEDTVEKVRQKLAATVDIPSSAEVIAQLRALKGAGTEYATKINDVSAQLTRCFISEGLPHATATKYTVRETVNAMVKSQTVERVKTVLQAGTFATPSAATAKYLEVSQEPSSSTGFAFRGRPQNWRRGGNNFGRSGGRHQYNNNNNYNNNYYNRGRGGGRGRNGHRNNNNYDNRRNNNQRSQSAFTMNESGNGSPPHQRQQTQDQPSMGDRR